MEKKITYNNLSVPGSIIIAGAIIAIAIIWTKQPVKTSLDRAITVNVQTITSSDHVLGNPNAPIKIIGYSDPSCPYCKIFNPTMIDIMKEYGPSGDVAWVYRHFPLNKPDANGNVLHANAGNESQALECVASLGGNDKFWAYEKLFYETTPSVTGSTPEGLDQTQLPVMAKNVGIDVTNFKDCLSSGKFSQTVDKQYLSGINAGVTGTPTSFIMLSKPANKSIEDYIGNTLLTNRMPPSMLYMSDDKKTISMSGAMPKEIIVGLITAIKASK